MSAAPRRKATKRKPLVVWGVAITVLGDKCGREYVDSYSISVTSSWTREWKRKHGGRVVKFVEVAP